MGKVYVYPTRDKDQEILLDSWDKRKEYMPLYSSPSRRRHLTVAR